MWLFGVKFKIQVNSKNKYDCISFFFYQISESGRT